MDNSSWREKLDQFKIPIGLSLVGIVLIIGGVFTSGLNKAQSKVFPKESLVGNQKILSVDVSGAVNTPGVYQLKDDSRIEDAVMAAGGFAQDANKEYISKYLNMAQKLSDGSKVYVPVEGEQTSGLAGTGAVTGAGAEIKVNINTATQAELEALSGIASTRASAIISDRPYSSVEDLVNKKIIPQSIFEKIKDQLVVY